MSQTLQSLLPITTRMRKLPPQQCARERRCLSRSRPQFAELTLHSCWKLARCLDRFLRSGSIGASLPSREKQKSSSGKCLGQPRFFASSRKSRYLNFTGTGGRRKEQELPEISATGS